MECLLQMQVGGVEAAAVAQETQHSAKGVCVCVFVCLGFMRAFVLCLVYAYVLSVCA